MVLQDQGFSQRITGHECSYETEEDRVRDRKP